MNEGKLFEKDFIDSVPEQYFKYRLRDSAGTWQGGENTRFTPSNICDFIIYTGKLFLLELKSHKGKSIPLSCIRENQLNGLLEAYKKGTHAGFIFNFRDINETYYLTANSLNSFMVTNNRKSIPLSYLKESGTLIPQKMKGRSKIHQIYDLTVLIN
jgi:recombination protein U